MRLIKKDLVRRAVQSCIQSQPYNLEYSFESFWRIPTFVWHNCYEWKDRKTWFNQFGEKLECTCTLYVPQKIGVPAYVLQEHLAYHLHPET